MNQLDDNPWIPSIEDIKETDEMFPPAMRPCPICDSRGYVGDGYTCTRCDGTGILPL